MLFVRHRQWSFCSLAVRADAWYWDLRQVDSHATPSKSGVVLLDVERTQEPLIKRILATRIAYEQASVSSAAAALLLGCDWPGTACSRRPRGSDLTIGTAAGPGTVSDCCRAGAELSLSISALFAHICHSAYHGYCSRTDHRRARYRFSIGVLC